MQSNVLFRAMELMRDALHLMANLCREMAYTEKEHTVSFKDLGKMFEGKQPTDIVEALTKLEPKAQAALVNLMKNLDAMGKGLQTAMVAPPADKLDFADKLDEWARNLEEAVGQGKILSKPTDMDKELIERCTNKDYHDTVTNAFNIVEDRIRVKLNDKTKYGSELVDFAFSPKTGKLLLGNSDAEREGSYFLMKGAFLYIRNAPSHTMNANDSGNAALKVLYTADFLLKMVEKATIKS